MKYCKNCGRPLEDHQRFCPDCGSDSGATPAPQPAPTSASQPAPQMAYNPVQQAGQNERVTNGMGIAALVCSLVGIVLLVVFIGIILEALGIIFGGICIYQCNREPERFQGKGLGVAGLVIGIVFLSLFVLGAIFSSVAWKVVF